MVKKYSHNSGRDAVIWRTDENGKLLGYRDALGNDHDLPMVVVSPTAAVDADGMPDGTVWIQTS